MYPKDETVEEREVRQARERKKARRNAIFGVLGVTAFPCISLSVLGAEWGRVSGAFAATSICSIIIATLGVAVATVMGLEDHKT